MKKTLLCLVTAVLLTALPVSAAERFEVTDGVYVELPDAFVAYTRDSVQDKQSDYLGIDVSMLTEFLEENGYCCMMLHGTHFSQCYFLVMSSIYQDFSDMTDSQLEEQNALIREEMEHIGHRVEPYALPSDGDIRWIALRLYPGSGYEASLAATAMYITVEQGRQIVVSAAFPNAYFNTGELEAYDRIVAGMTVERVSPGPVLIIAVAVIVIILLGAGVIVARSIRRRKNGPDSLPPEAYL